MYSSVTVLSILGWLDRLHVKPVAQNKCVTGSLSEKWICEIIEKDFHRMSWGECSCLEVGVLGDHSEQRGEVVFYLGIGVGRTQVSSSDWMKLEN